VSKPGPVLEGLTGEWYGFVAQGELRFQRCGSCGRWRHPPRIACPHCGSGDWSWELSSGHGDLHSWTVTHQALHPAWADDAPYAIAVAAMAEGVRLVAGWRGPLDALDLGVAVTVSFETRDDGLAVPLVEPA
jgi:uncharacterized OB-fold protein